MNYQTTKQWLHITIDVTQQNLTLQQWLDKMVPSRSLQHNLFQNKQILLNHHTAHRIDPLKVHDILSVQAFQSGIDFPGIPYDFDVIYEDAFFLIINKPYNLLVHPDHPDNHQTLVNQIADYYQHQGIAYPIRPIHRLDKDTSGLIMICKCSLLQPLMDQLLSQKQIYRTYLAVVEGTFQQKSGMIDQPIGKDRHYNNRYRVSKTGKPAITKYRVLKQTKQQSLVACTLVHGRTHQIRVHLSSINHPILYDPIYGHPATKHHLALHAWKLSFYHPLDEQQVHVKCDPRNDFPLQ